MPKDISLSKSSIDNDMASSDLRTSNGCGKVEEKYSNFEPRHSPDPDKKSLPERSLRELQELHSAGIWRRLELAPKVRKSFAASDSGEKKRHMPYREPQEDQRHPGQRIRLPRQTLSSHDTALIDECVAVGGEDTARIPIPALLRMAVEHTMNQLESVPLCPTMKLVKGLTTQYALSRIPYARAAPIKSGPAEDIHAALNSAWYTFLLLAPFIIILMGTGRLLYIKYRRSRPLEHPVFSGAFAMIVAFVWWVLRSLDPEAGEKKAIVFTIFLALWTDFLVDSCRLVEEKRQYLLAIVFGGGTVNLIFTALSFIASSDTGSRGGLAEYLHQTVDNGPFWYVLTTVIIYVFQIYDEEKKVKKAEADREREHVA